ncbi:helix-turn-helix transcriptional regulator [Frankia sp. Cas4]|uniref:helix-turn-helix domain-containing protein n=1 Tax=Frankia sp. Cas4 TaxID=3073927 RepID=UPI002AD289FF|nr:helix-turn-helix transcriptional regulator [Frankia sp. Cas4]
MPDSDAVLAARAALGAELAALRKQAGHTQHSLAPLIYVSRSTLANVEIGYQHTTKDLWQRADAVLGAGGVLVRGYEEVEAARRDQRQMEAHAAQAAREARVEGQRAVSQTEARALLGRLALGQLGAHAANAASASANQWLPSVTDSVVRRSSPAPVDPPSGNVGAGSLTLPGGPCQVIASTGDVVIVAIDRRIFLAGTGLLIPGAGLELSRHNMHRSLVADPSAADVSEWQEIAWEHSVSYMTVAPGELLGSLQVDLVALGNTVQGPHSDTASRELRKVAALLAAVTAHTVANLGDIRSSRRWWRTAKQAADESGDVQTRLWIRGREVQQALHEPRAVPVILDLVAEAETIRAGLHTPPAALPGLLAGKAQTLARAGQATSAEAALREVRDNFDALPVDTTGDTESLFGWSERAVRFTESYVYANLGDYARADQANAAALALYPATFPRGPVVIELQRALCLVRAGDILPGVEHAHAVMTSLPREQHIRPIADLGHNVLSAVPPAEQGHDSVQTFHAYLTQQEAA